jgi:hypothetical protein
MIRSQLPGKIGGAPDLDRDIIKREDDPTLAEGAGDRRGHDEAHQHDGEDQAADARRLRVEPVGDPAGISPAEPDGEPEDQRLDGPGYIEIGQEVMTGAASPRRHRRGRRTVPRR